MTRRLRLLLVYFLLLWAVHLLFVAQFWGHHPPKDHGDAVDYDSIAFNLVAGRGFGHNWGDPAFRAPYEPYIPLNSDYRNIFMDDHGGGHWTPKPDRYAPTAFRPPGLPLVLAAIYQTVGRHFIVFRVINAGLIALAVTLAVALAWRIAGSAAIIVGVLGVIDPALKRYVGWTMTEGPVLLMIVLLAWQLVRLAEFRQWRDVILLGVLLGVMLLFRTIFVLWLVPLAVVVGVVFWRHEGTQARRHEGSNPAGASAGSSRLRAFMPSCLRAFTVLLLALLIYSPWAIRNCLLLDAFMPLGTQGGISLPGGYSDEALHRDLVGVWYYHDPSELFAPIDAELRAQQAEPIVWERERARYGQHIAKAWALENWRNLPWLMLMRPVQMWIGPWSVVALFLTLVGLVTLPAAWRGGARSVPQRRLRRTGRAREAGARPQERLARSAQSNVFPTACFPQAATTVLAVCWVLLLINHLPVIATYSAGGRFLIPLVPLIYILGAAGMVTLWRIVRGYGPAAAPAPADPATARPDALP